MDGRNQSCKGKYGKSNWIEKRNWAKGKKARGREKKFRGESSGQCEGAETAFDLKLFMRVLLFVITLV